MSAPSQAPGRLPPPPVDPSVGAAPASTSTTGTAPPPTAGQSSIPSGAAAREITEPVDGSGIAQKPVPERADPQQAATGPGQGSVVGDSVPFKEQAHGYAKKFHGMVTGNKEEKAYGEEVIKGQAN